MLSRFGLMQYKFSNDNSCKHKTLGLFLDSIERISYCLFELKAFVSNAATL